MKEVIRKPRSVPKAKASSIMHPNAAPVWAGNDTASAWGNVPLEPGDPQVRALFGQGKERQPPERIHPTLTSPQGCTV